MIARGACATLRPVRWLIVLPFARPGLMGMDFAEELRALGRQVRTFAYRRDNPLYKNRGTKAAYQRWILRRLERVCLAWRPSVVLVIKGGPITPALIRRVKSRLDIAFVNFFPDNPLWMLPFEAIEAYDLFFTKERYAKRSLEQVGLRNLAYLPMYCVPGAHHPVTPTEEESRRWARGSASSATATRTASGSSANSSRTRCVCLAAAGRAPRTERSARSRGRPCSAARSSWSTRRPPSPSTTTIR